MAKQKFADIRGRQPSGWYTDDDGSQYFIDGKGNRIDNPTVDYLIKPLYNKTLKPLLKWIDKRGYDNYQLYLKEKEKRDSDTTLNLTEKIEKSLKEDATRFQSNMKKKTIKWRPEYNTYMSDYDYNIQLLIDARKANE